MIIRLEGVLYKTDPWIAELFTDILNALGGAATPAELHHALLRLCMPGHGPPVFPVGIRPGQFLAATAHGPTHGSQYERALSTQAADGHGLQRHEFITANQLTKWTYKKEKAGQNAPVCRRP